MCAYVYTAKCVSSLECASCYVLTGVTTDTNKGHELGHNDTHRVTLTHTYTHTSSSSPMGCGASSTGQAGMCGVMRRWKGVGEHSVGDAGAEGICSSTHTHSRSHRWMVAWRNARKACTHRPSVNKPHCLWMTSTCPPVRCMGHSRPLSCCASSWTTKAGLVSGCVCVCQCWV